MRKGHSADSGPEASGARRDCVPEGGKEAVMVGERQRRTQRSPTETGQPRPADASYSDPPGLVARNTGILVGATIGIMVLARLLGF
jgi:hypothetical protein